jgi:hypothetical protein
VKIDQIKLKNMINNNDEEIEMKESEFRNKHVRDAFKRVHYQNKPTEYVQCKKCEELLKYVDGTTSCTRHMTTTCSGMKPQEMSK